MKINIKIIPLDTMRYKSAGDYFLSLDGTWQFRIAQLNDRRYEQLVLIHELVEALLVQQAGITIEAIDAWDQTYQEANADGAPKAPCGCKWQDEPGADIHAPYHAMHEAATVAEKAAAESMGVLWRQYEQALDALFEEK